VAATDEVWRLQNGKGPECRYFQAMASKGHYRDPGGTRQGIYVCSPSGQLLCSVNTLDVDAVCQTLQAGLKAWDELPADARRLSPDFQVRHDPRWEDQLPRGGLILESTNRDLAHPPAPSAEPVNRWNLDHVWFSPAEMRQWLPTDLTVGSLQPLPEKLLERLVRFHLVDNVRGQTLPFARPDLAGSEILVQVADRTGSTVHLRIRGSTTAASGSDWDMSGSDWKPEPDHPRGIATQVLGRATYDTTASQFTQFELIALGYRWGFSENNGRRHQAEPSPVGYYFTLLPPDAVVTVPPAFIDVYNADWLKRPAGM
jgi:hypothetical protein